MGAPICYSRSRQAYFYCYRVVFKFGYEKEEGQTVDKEKNGWGKPQITWRIHPLFFTSSIGECEL